MADNFDVDYFVIGGGSGGVRSARIAARHGARVALAEDRDMGGTCVNRGCVPKKFMVFAGQYGQAIADAGGYGWAIKGQPGFDWPTLRDRVMAEVSRLSGLYQKGLDGVEAKTYRGHASLLSPHEVVVGDDVISARQILIATGGEPSRLDIPGGEHALVSDDVFSLPALPKRLLVVGGGYIALEFSSIFNALGSDVTVAYRRDQILRGFDHDLRGLLGDELIRHGIDIRCHVTPVSIEKTGSGLVVTLSDGNRLTVDQVLMAVGRRPRTGGLNLAGVGVALDEQGAVIVDREYRSTVPSIFAVGDVTNRINLTPVAIREGHWLADHLFGPAAGKHLDYNHVATAVFTTPELASIGMTEEAALAAGHEVEIFRSRFRPMRHALTPEPAHALLKLVVCRSSRRVLGAHMLGEGAGEIIQGLAVAVTMGATKEQFDQTVALHPTIAEEFVTLREAVPSTLPSGEAAA